MRLLFDLIQPFSKGEGQENIPNLLVVYTCNTLSPFLWTGLRVRSSLFWYKKFSLLNNKIKTPRKIQGVNLFMLIKIYLPISNLFEML